MVNIQNCLKLQTNLIKHCVWNFIQHFKYYLFGTSMWYTGEMPARPCSSLDPLCSPLHPCPSHCGRETSSQAPSYDSPKLCSLTDWFFVLFLRLAVCFLHVAVFTFCCICLLFVASLFASLVLIAVHKQTLGDMGLLPQITYLDGLCLFVLLWRLAVCLLHVVILVFFAFVCCLLHHFLLVCCIFLHHLSFFAFSNTDRTDVNFQGCLLHRLHWPRPFPTCGGLAGIVLTAPTIFPQINWHQSLTISTDFINYNQE